jgi:hypothetical protein
LRKKRYGTILKIKYTVFHIMMSSKEIDKTERETGSIEKHVVMNGMDRDIPTTKVTFA